MKAPMIYLTKKEKESLLERFDEKNAELEDFGYCVNKLCLLCLKYEEAGCVGCPANVGPACCASIVRDVVGSPMAVELSKGYISWMGADKVAAEKELKKIRAYIRKCPVKEKL